MRKEDFKNKWYEALISALVAFLTALSCASCVQYSGLNSLF